MNRMLAIVLCLFTVSLHGQEGSLSQAREDVRSPRTDSAPRKDSSKDCNDPTSSDTDSVEAKLIFHTLMLPYYIPHFTLVDDYYDKGAFLSYPYAEKWNGVMQREHDRCWDGETPDTWNRLMSYRVSVENGNDFLGLNRVGIQFLADTMLRLGIGGSVNFYEEKREGLPPDQLIIGDVNVLFRFAQSPRWQWRSGLGLRWMDDHRQTDYGFNFVYGVEWFPLDPITVGMQLEAGTLGNTGVIRFTSRIGLVWKHAEAYVGYDYLQIGGAELAGPMIGLRVWY
jgi:hypothetical protein